MNLDSLIKSNGNMQKMLDQFRDPAMIMKMFGSTNDPKLFSTIVETAGIDIIKYGAEFMHAAAEGGKAANVTYLMEQGVDVNCPPDSIPKDETYRKTPFLISAAKSGDVNTFETILNAGRSTNEKGFVCYSRKRKNLVTSNIVGAAAFNG